MHFAQTVRRRSQQSELPVQHAHSITDTNHTSNTFSAFTRLANNHNNDCALPLEGGQDGGGGGKMHCVEIKLYPFPLEATHLADPHAHASKHTSSSLFESDKEAPIQL